MNAEVEVELTGEDLRLAGELGKFRGDWAVAHPEKSKNGQERDPDLVRFRHHLGATGEIAVAKWLSVPYPKPDPNYDPRNFPIDFPPDLEVHAVERKSDRLYLHDRSKDFCRFMLVRVWRPWVYLVGWIPSPAPYKRDEFAEVHRDGGRCYFVPNGKLEAIADFDRSNWQAKPLPDLTAVDPQSVADVWDLLEGGTNA